MPFGNTQPFGQAIYTELEGMNLEEGVAFT